MPNLRRHRLTLLACCAAALLAGCGGSDAPDEASKLKVAAAFFPLQEAARQIGGERVTVTDLTPVGGQPHDLQPSPAASAALEAARVVLTMGSDFQPEVSRQVEALPAATIRVDLLAGSDALPAPELIPGVRGPIDGATAGQDPHAWLSPGRFIAMVGQIRDALVRADPEGRDAYVAGADAYLERLRALDAAFSTALGTCRAPVILTTHPAFAYLAEDLGLEQAVTAGISPAARPDPAALAATKRFASRRDVTTLYLGAPVPSALERRVKADAGLEARTLNPIEGLTQDQVDAGATYVGLMQANLSALVDGLRCTPGT